MHMNDVYLYFIKMQPPWELLCRQVQSETQWKSAFLTSVLISLRSCKSWCQSVMAGDVEIFQTTVYVLNWLVMKVCIQIIVGYVRFGVLEGYIVGQRHSSLWETAIHPLYLIEDNDSSTKSATWEGPKDRLTDCKTFREMEEFWWGDDASKSPYLSILKCS